jgi:hypothetical protein
VAAGTLRNPTFFSLVELNAAISEKLEWLNNRPIKKMNGSRRSLFEDIDRPALRAAGKPLRVRNASGAGWRARNAGDRLGDVARWRRR